MMHIKFKIWIFVLSLIFLSCSSKQIISKFEPPFVELTLERIQSGEMTKEDSVSHAKLLNLKFSPPTQMNFTVPEKDSIKITLYDIQGSPVTQTFCGLMEKGNYFVRPNVIGLKSGIYFFRLNVGNKLITKNVIIMK